MISTARQRRAAAAYADGRLNQAQIAGMFGLKSQSAISKRIARFIQKLTPRQADAYRRRTRKGYRKALAAGEKKIKFFPMQLSLAVNY